MKKIRIIFIVIVFFVIVLTFSLYILNRNKERKFLGSGIIESKEVIISSKISGKILKFFVKEGDSVSINDTLLVIEHNEILLQLDEAKAGLIFAQKNLEEIRLKKESIKKNYERAKALYSTGDMAEKDFEDIETQLKLISVQEEKLIAQIKSAEAKLNLCKLNISNAYILSPISGRVLSKNYEEGEILFAGSEVIKIGDFKDLWVKIFLPLKELDIVYLGMKVDVIVEPIFEKKFTGEVFWISNEAEFTPKNVQTRNERLGLVYGVKVRIIDAKDNVFPGMSASIYLRNDINRSR